MIWKGKELNTIGDVMKFGIDKCETFEEAQEFMKLFRADTEHADANISYLGSYYGAEKAKRLKEWFGVGISVYDK